MIKILDFISSNIKYYSNYGNSVENDETVRANINSNENIRSYIRLNNIKKEVWNLVHLPFNITKRLFNVLYIL
jgi:hypothetical protein